jgi:hypothetical protein
MNSQSPLSLKEFYSFLSSLTNPPYCANDLPTSFFEHDVTCRAMLEEPKIVFTLDDVSPSIRDNPLFLAHYFSVRARDPAEYSMIPDNLLNDSYFITQIIKHNPDIFLLTHEQHRNNPLFLESIERLHHSCYMKYMPVSMQDDRGKCATALKHHSANFQWFSEAIKTDSFFYGEAIGMLAENAKHLPKELLQQKEHAERIVSYNGVSLFYLPAAFKNDEVIVKKAIANKSEAFQFASASLRSNDDLIDYALKCEKNQSGPKNKILSFVTYDKFNDFDFVQRQQKNIAETFSAFSPKYRQHINILWAAFSDNDERNFFQMNLVKSGELKEQLKTIAKQQQGTRHQPAGLLIRRFTLHQSLKEHLLNDEADDIIEHSSPKI